MPNTAYSMSYDRVQLAVLKEAYFDALGSMPPGRVDSLQVHRAEEALIDFADELFTEDPKTRALLRRLRMDARPQLIRLILRLSTE